jgi:hypothetical protein
MEIMIPYTYQWLIEKIIFDEEEKARIINEVANDPAYMDACRKISKAEGQVTKLSQDLYQECMLVLMEKPASLIIHLYNTRSIRFYFVRIVMSQWISGGEEDVITGSSPFWNKYRKYSHTLKGFGEEYNFDFSHSSSEETPQTKHKVLLECNVLDEEDSETTYYNDLKKLKNDVEDIIADLNWFDWWILELYLEGDLKNNKPWTFTTLAKELKMGRNKVNDSLQATRRYIRERMNIKKERKNIW